MTKDKAKDRKADTPAAAPRLPLSRLAPWVAVLAVVILVVAVRVRLANLPLERDEGEYAYAGQLMLQGVPPYELAYNMKFPGVYAAYAVLMAVFGQTTAGIHLGMAVVSAATMVLVFLLGRRLINAWTGVMAAAAYGVMAMSPSVLGLAGHATHFVVLAAVGGLVLLLRGIQKNSILMFLWSGLCLGTAVLMKQHGALFAVAAGLFLVWTVAATRPVRWLRSLGQLGLLAAGTLVPFGLTCLALWWAGVFDRFWFWTFQYASQYASVVSFSDGMKMLEEVFGFRVGAAAGLWVMAGLGLVAAVVAAAVKRDRKTADVAIFLTLLAACSFVATGMGFYWRDHYFIMMLPAVALAAAAAAGLVVEAAAKKPLFWLLAAPAILVFVMVFGLAVSGQRETFFSMAPTDVCRAMYGANPFPESYKIAEYLEAHTEPGDRVAVLGSEPQIFFYAHRRSATGYIYTYGLMEPQPYAHTMQEEMIREVEAARPKYVVWVGIPTSWLRRPDSDATLFDWIDHAILPRYECVGVIDLACGPETGMKWVDVQRWGADAASGPRSPYNVLILKARGS